jgi:uncharacterized protein with ATP-grasp and redox domains
VRLSERDSAAFKAFVEQCSRAERFLLIADNCGEIVLDKIFIEELQKCFPALDITVMVRGAEVLNDATEDDAATTPTPSVFVRRYASLDIQRTA